MPTDPVTADCRQAAGLTMYSYLRSTSARTRSSHGSPEAIHRLPVPPTVMTVGWKLSNRSYQMLSTLDVTSSAHLWSSQFAYEADCALVDKSILSSTCSVTEYRLPWCHWHENLELLGMKELLQTIGTQRIEQALPWLV
jgi:hypothetical protein